MAQDVNANDNVVSTAREGAVAVLTLQSGPVNALGTALRQGILAAVEAAEADAAVKAIVLIGGGRMFSAGADITEFGKPQSGISLPDLLNRIEASTKPVVAAIHGNALGGGLETALACHYRVAVPSAKVGLPEVKLGILPGAGGTQRLPRVVGPRKALDVIVGGSPIGAKAAAAMGLIDELAPEDSLRAHAVAFAERVVAEGRPLLKIRDRDDKIAEGRENPGLFAAFREENARKTRGFEAPEACIACIEAACRLPFDEGLAFERAEFQKLVSGTQSAAQRYVFFAERQAAKIPDVPDDTPARPIARVGVIGAGTMGGGISMNFLNAGIPVTIVETKRDALDRGIKTIRTNYENTAKKGRLKPEDVETRMGLLTDTLELEKLAECDLIIEAVFEDMGIKKEIFSKLDQIAKPGAILASNTSYLDIDAIAAMTSRPADVIGMHFFSPANVMRLLEVVRGEKTAKDVIATAMQIGRKVGKIPVLVGVCHGFVGNRMLAQRQREANRLILEGVTPWDVDRVVYEFGLPMGPFTMSDLAGLDIGWSRETNKSESVRDLLCEQDRRGQKTSAGFYDYDAKRKATPSTVTEEIIARVAERQGVKRKAATDQEILERTLYPMINEGAKILEEGKAIRASDIDIVWINGYGWPVYRGGPMFWADTIGLPKVLERLRAYEAEYGEAFKPSALLERLAAEGKGFKDL
ncbi:MULTISPECIES: 3-hydroxyacyl-CoA dehydrogenase NAD-binding domain-containing protein [Methylobacterium]|jgi:3-hydroxyacyl-CoA dehydrogenase|uniref:3-hydroxyacyl-CoA dehydrogenase NAD-binding domain-containing protein n=1 Tax=Methylobacterium TaxID=407 RepID=UPI0008E1C3B3|nr:MULTISPECIES: 3-hydroxyacyl-CoA dehydrogenase NAD-binding domain-containing protein [Methylobacterium]MBZ6415074.1 enoyl-CoA hydratase/isomerase family protein [Methylobacterium sp.]MBK3397368.1 enoyl-CoA hydratase/isomerase family protein [Methylobacterium ajmalii]MBK3412599.1 enoyl-CoA hydratase/isomerase family protein [Methylobacterium ajmalii]MBK3421609.1 enoyl-CoA hydratase/isomerase family protein [Methylobacterium ajmalii]SFF31757.1 3-hydroxyacyl-CoA dehydrogenase [Methylobacterium 